nr:PREDICTED: putative spermatogenesis-associated protein 31D4 [Equus przewalskii]
MHTILSPDSALSQDVNLLPKLSETMDPTDSLTSHHTPPTLSVSSSQDSALTVTQSDSISTLLNPVLENSSLDSPGGFSNCVPPIKGTDHSSLSVSEFSPWEAHAKDLFHSTLAQCDFNQEFLALHSSEGFLRGEPANNLVDLGNLPFLSPDVLALLERQVQNRSDFLMRDSFPKELGPDYQLHSSEKMLESVADKHDSAFSLPFWSSKGKPKELLVHQQPPYPKTSEDHLQQKHVQLFSGLPSLHSESLAPADHVSGDCSSIFIFTTIFNASPAEESPVLSHHLPLSSPEIQPQALPQTLSQSKPLPVTQVQPQAHFHSLLPILRSGPLPETKICGVCFHRPPNESESLVPSEIQHLEWNVLEKQQESFWGLPSVVQRPGEDICPSAANSPYP